MRLSVVLAVILTANASLAFSWTNSFKVVNNSDSTIHVQVQNETTDCSGGGCIVSTCSSPTNQVISKHALGCELSLNSGWIDGVIALSNKGLVTISDPNNPNNYCQMQYQSTDDSLQNFKDHTEQMTNLRCFGDMSPEQISVVSPEIESIPRPIAFLGWGDFSEALRSFAIASCGGSDNCIILSPKPVTDGSTLAQSLNIQAQIGHYESLNVEQFIGGHNSAVSAYYTSTDSGTNLSNIDPDAYWPLPTQLNFGVRQIELDVEWSKEQNTIVECHNHVTNNPLGKDFLCDGAIPIEGQPKSMLNEIETWAKAHPQDLLILYFDVNEPIDSHLDAFNQDIKNTIGERVFTPGESKYYFGTEALPASHITANDLTYGLEKNIIIVNNDGAAGDKPDLTASPYVFTAVQNSNSAPIPDKTPLAFSNTHCAGNLDKYNLLNTLYDDANHQNLFRVNGERTVIDFISNALKDGTDTHEDYISARNLPNMLACPINIYAVNALGYAVRASDQTKVIATDPRLYAFLWSWALSYPRADGGNLAVIENGHFTNPVLKPGRYPVLCVDPNNQPGPIKPLQWQIVYADIHSQDDSWEEAHDACFHAYKDFAVPTTSYWMDDVNTLIQSEKIHQPVLVNYQWRDGEWEPNSRQMLIQKLK